MAQQKSLPVRLVQQPWVWSGVGLLVRYYDDGSVRGYLWKSAGVLAIAYGIRRALLKTYHG